ncbi:spermidine synthase, partial [Streptomyces sp. URMC 123]
AARVLADDGRLAVHAGSPGARPAAYWTVEATVRSVGLRTLPYRVGGRLSRFVGGPDRASTAEKAPDDWGFVLASFRRPRPTLSPEAPALRSLTRATLRDAVLPRTRRMPPSTLMHPRYLD